VNHYGINLLKFISRLAACPQSICVSPEGFHVLSRGLSLMSLRIVKRLAKNKEMGSDCWYEKQSAIYRAAGNSIGNI
jgi:hypothetical protein